ncbi:polymorphic toxin-type HINT domain-containing protein [Nocardiopsis chromatogenes]|uniref:polymorphic toxin-type HINT domain-containing protein n=1 Tax=Nocardiopsis chromatogenes TaxID=280239 RepID=UPI00037623E6|nr:polymorphic toxin-type HINT domain-containing protein [Nocardiopsis chromatogenes]
MLRRIHNPERGANAVEYAAVILLIAAILSVLMDLRTADRIASLLQNSVDSVSDAQADGGGDDATPSLAGEDSNDMNVPTSTAPHETDGSSAHPTDGADSDNALWDGKSPVYEYVLSDAPPDDGLYLAPGDELSPEPLEPLGEINPDDPFLERFLDAMITAVVGDMAGAIEGLWALVTDAPQAVATLIQSIQEDPWGLLVSQELREAFSEGDWALVLGYGLWEFGTLLAVGAGIALKMLRVLSKVPDGGKLPGTPDSSPDKGNSSDQGGGEKDEGSKDEESKEEKDSPCESNSFAPGTGVLMADGSTAPIESIEVGDEVWAFDPLTAEEGPRPVTATIEGQGEKTLVDITVKNEDGTAATVTATAGHPFWAPARAEWVNATELQSGDRLRTSAGAWTQVSRTREQVFEGQRVYNLTVDGLSTYYTVFGSASVLTHNSGCPPTHTTDPQGNTVKLPQVNTKISTQKQNRHILGGKGHSNGGYLNSHADAQAVLDAYHSGNARVIGTTKAGHIKIEVKSVTGYDNNPRMGRKDVPTHTFLIKGTKSPSIVPTAP